MAVRLGHEVLRHDVSANEVDDTMVTVDITNARAYHARAPLQKVGGHMKNVRSPRQPRRAVRACLTLAAALAVLAAASSAAVAGPFVGNDSVDGGEIRYEDYTKYDGARTLAISAWNALGSISILPDDAWHICDLEIRDVYDPAGGYYGSWQPFAGADRLSMNKAKLDPITPDTERTQFIRHTMAHEFGHALGIGDHYDAKWHDKILMYAEVHRDCNEIRTPQAQDRVDYYALW